MLYVSILHQPKVINLSISEWDNHRANLIGNKINPDISKNGKRGIFVLLEIMKKENAVTDFTTSNLSWINPTKGKKN